MKKEMRGGAREGTGPKKKDPKEKKVLVRLYIKQKHLETFHKKIEPIMKKLLLIALVAFVSCNTVKPVIVGNQLKDGKNTYEIKKSPGDRSYIIKDGKRKNLYRKPEIVKQ